MEYTLHGAVLGTTPELSGAGDPKHPDWQPTSPARIHSSDLAPLLGWSVAFMTVTTPLNLRRPWLQDVFLSIGKDFPSPVEVGFASFELQLRKQRREAVTINPPQREEGHG